MVQSKAPDGFQFCKRESVINSHRKYNIQFNKKDLNYIDIYGNDIVLSPLDSTVGNTISGK